MKSAGFLEIISTKTAFAGAAIGGTGAVGVENGWFSEWGAIVLAIIAFANLGVAAFGKYLEWRRLRREEKTDGRHKQATAKTKT